MVKPKKDRIEQSYERAVRAAKAALRATLRGEDRMPANPVIRLTPDGFSFGEACEEGTWTVTEGLFAQDDAIAEYYLTLDWIGDEFLRKDRAYREDKPKTQADWRSALKQVRAGGSFTPLFPWSERVKGR